MGARPTITIRDAEATDAPALVELWRECAGAAADEGSEAFTQQSLWREPSTAEAATALTFNQDTQGRKIMVALSGGEIVGATAGSIATLTPITFTKVLVVTDIQVSPRFRRRSVASALLETMAVYGEEHHCEIVMAMIPAHAKEPNRYLTKLGFNQIAVLRVIQMSKLRARLGGKTASRETSRLVAVRRTLRRHQRQDALDR